MYTASWSEIRKASSTSAFPKLPVTWSLPMPSAMVSYLLWIYITHHLVICATCCIKQRVSHTGKTLSASRLITACVWLRQAGFANYASIEKCMQGTVC